MINDSDIWKVHHSITRTAYTLVFPYFRLWVGDIVGNDVSCRKPVAAVTCIPYNPYNHIACFNSIQNSSHSSSVSKHLAKHLPAALWYLVVTSALILQVTCREYPRCWCMLRCRQFPVSAREGSCVNIEALMADRLRHILEELLPTPRRCVYVCVTSPNDSRQRAKQTNELLKAFIYNQFRVTFKHSFLLRLRLYTWIYC